MIKRIAAFFALALLAQQVNALRQAAFGPAGFQRRHGGGAGAVRVLHDAGRR